MNECPGRVAFLTYCYFYLVEVNVGGVEAVAPDQVVLDRRWPISVHHANPTRPSRKKNTRSNNKALRMGGGGGWQKR